MTDMYGTGPRGKATRLHSELVRARGFCQACALHWPPMPETRTRLECAHIISRSYASTRTLTENAFCLCASHHARFTRFGVEWADFIDVTIGREAYDLLWERARSLKKVDWPAEVARLSVLLKEVEDAA